MAYTVITRPAELSMSGNIADFVLDSNAPVTFKLAVGGKVILDEIYTPTSAGAITIKLRKVIEQQLTLSIPTSDFFEQSKSVIYFLATIDTIDYGFRVVKGGVDANVLDAATYLSQNFLTWQPQSKQVKLNDPEWLTYFSTLYATKVVKAKGYYIDNTTETIVVYTIDEEPKCWTMNMQYALLAGKFTAAPSYIDVWVEDSNGVRLTFIQRYILQADFDEFDDLFVFENSLGGIDTIRYTGTLQEINEPDVASAIFGEETMEYGLDVDRYFSKNTGGFKSERHQQWAVDFFNSYNRYRIADGVVRRIVLRKADIKGVKRDVNSFSFNFAYTKQTNRLNLARFDTLPDVIEMVDPNSELFFLAPRLSEFPTAPLAYNFLFPIQSPYEKKWYKASIYEIANLLTTEGGVGQNALDSEKWNGHRWDDYMEQALKKASDVEFHNAKVNNLQAADTVINSLVSALYQSGFNGNGFKIDADGNAEVKSLMVRDQLTVLELVVQKLRSVGGMIILSAANGTAAKVELKENSYYRVTLDTTGTIVNPFVVDDLVKCQRFNGGVKYYWRRVVAIGSDYIDLAKDGGDGTGIPEVGDSLVQLGHLTDTSRQNAIILDATALPRIDIYQGIDSYSLVGKLKSRLGDLSEQGIQGMGIFTSQGRFTGQVVIGGGSTGYENFTDKPDLSVYPLKTYVDSQASALQNQIDGQLISYFGDIDPTPANYPAWEWTTDLLKNQHANDTYTNTHTGGCWRYQQVNGVWDWGVIADTATQQSLIAAGKAQDTADGKRRVFTSQPTAPYDAGDLWAKGTSIYKCDVPKLAGQAYAASDWSVTATDDTAAIAAQTAANAANAKISDMAADGKITPVEKKTLSQLLDVPISEYDRLVSQANQYNVSPDSYDDSYYDLLSYVGPLLSDMTATSTVDRAVLEQKFYIYNETKIQLLNAISTAINGTATTALTQSSAVFPSDSGLLAYWSFDEVPEIPDGAYIYKSKQGWITGVDGWVANGGALTIDSGLLKITGANSSGIGMYRGWQASFEDKSLIYKVKSKNKIQNAAYYTNSGYSDALNPTIVDDYTWIVRFDSIQNNTYNALIIAVNRDLTNTEDGWIEWIYIGDGSYATKISDNSGNGRALINQGALAISTGISGKSLSFNGASHAEVDSSDFRNAKFTISAWFKSPGMGVGQSIGGIVCITYMVRLELNANGTISFFGSGSNGGVINGQANLFGGWHHVAAVYTGTQIALYVDGSLIGLTQAVVSWDHSNPLYIGTDPNNSPWHFNGLIDEVRVYNRDLSGAEVLGLYKHVTKGKAFAVDMETAYLKEALRNDTSIAGGLVSTTLLKVGAVSAAGVWEEKAGINGASSGPNTPRVYAGGTLAEAVARVGGSKAKAMAVITEGAKAIFDSGEIGGFEIMAQGIEKTESVTNDGDTYTGTFSLDWKEQAINFLRDGATKVKLSAKKLLTGIPSAFTQVVGTGTWKNAVVPNATTPLATLYNLSPAGYSLSLNYTCQEFQDDYILGEAYLTGTIDAISIAVTFTVKVNVWKTDSAGNKVGATPIASKTKITTVSASNSGTSATIDSVSLDFNLSTASYVSFEVVVAAVQNNSMHWESADSSTYGTETFNCMLSHSNTSATYNGNSEFFEVGYTGFRVVSELAYLIFNTLEATHQLLLRGNAYLRSKYLNTSVYLDDASFRASRLDLQGMLANFLIKSSNYAMVAADEAYAGVAVIGASATVTITLPDLNASKTVNGQTIYYNDRRVLFVVATTKQIALLPYTGQTFSGATSGTIDYNRGYIYIGNRATLNWLCIGVG